MLEKEVLKLDSIEEEMEDDHFLIKLKVSNSIDRTVYAYSSPRKILYDPATKTLNLILHDHDVAENSILTNHLLEPAVKQVAGNSEGEIKLKLPKVIHRIKSAAETGGGKIEVELLNIQDAENVNVEIAYQDTPFYYKPGKKNNLAQLKQWGGIISKAKFDLKKRKKDRE